MEWIKEWDANILLWIQEHCRMEGLNELVIFITHLGDAGILWIALGFILLAYRKTRRTGVCTLSALVISFLVNNVFLKNVIARQRPYEAIESLNRIIEAQSDYSFPSGHTANSIVAATVIFLMLPKKYSWTFLLLAILISISRLYVGVHYPTDVICGMLTGVIIACLVVSFEKRIRRKKNQTNHPAN